MVSGLPYYKSIAAAESAVQGGRDYVLWHNPNHVAARARRFFSSGLHETVVSANIMRLENFSRIRHRIVHSQTDAKNKFNAVAMALAGRRYPKARPGKFLRDTSELIIAQLDGMQDKKKSIDRFYEEFDSEYPQRARMNSRFRETIDVINEAFPDTLRDTEFSRAPLFYTLYCAVYHYRRGLKVYLSGS